MSEPCNQYDARARAFIGNSRDRRQHARDGFRLTFTFINQTMGLLTLSVLSLLLLCAEALRFHWMLRPMIAGGVAETPENAGIADQVASDRVLDILEKL
jgi:hypothetical protein